ncbi:hypothetical protein LguiB_018648 [Lonicera macranthoides]
MAEFKQSKDLKKTDGTKRGRITGITKLEDADDVGGKNCDKCTLILTEGDSAKALAMAGISVIMENVDTKNLKRVLGLQHGKDYDNVKSLRHEFITPIVKVTNEKTKKVIAFYSMPEYESWKESLQGAKGWKIKYYKGLGTSTGKDTKEYFKDLGRHKKDLIWVDEQDGDAIELAFSKKKIEARKNWLQQFEPGIFLDQTHTIVGMAQDFVGSNNINLLEPREQFSTSHQGIKTMRVLDGKNIEPTWYMPVIPTVLVNGSEGIGTGWSSYVPNYNPRDLVANVRRLLNGKPMEPMDPWYKGFREEINETTLRLTELPIRKWNQDYKEFLEPIMMGNKKIKDPFIKDYREHNDHKTVHFKVMLSEENFMMAKQERPEQILEEFFHARLAFYQKRKDTIFQNLKLELLKLDNKVRFILAVVGGEITVSNRKKRVVF